MSGRCWLRRLDGVFSLAAAIRPCSLRYVRREALLSSQNRGHQSSLSDLLLFELEEAPRPTGDVRSRFPATWRGLEHGLARLREGFPLFLPAMLREIHARAGWPLVAGPDRHAPGSFAVARTGSGGTRPG